MAVKFQAANKTQMALEFFWNYLGILRNPMPSVNYDRKSQNFITEAEGLGILEEFQSHLFSFSCWNCSKILRRRILGADGFG